jgi:hypothetical protein
MHPDTTRRLGSLLAALAATTTLAHADDFDLEDIYDMPRIEVTQSAGVIEASLLDGRTRYRGHASGWSVRGQVDSAALRRLRLAWEEAREVREVPQHGGGGLMAQTVIEVDYPDDADRYYIDPYEPTAADLLRGLLQQASWLRQPAGRPTAVSLAVFDVEGGARVLEFDGTSLRMRYELGGYTYPLQAPKLSGFQRALLRRKLRVATIDVHEPPSGGSGLSTPRRVELRFRDGLRSFGYASEAVAGLPQRGLVRALERLLRKAAPITQRTQPAQVIHRQAWVDSQTVVSTHRPLASLLANLDGAQVLLRTVRQGDGSPVALYLLAHEEGQAVLAVHGLSPDPESVIALSGSIRPAFPLPSLIDADGYLLWWGGDLEFDWSGQQLPQDGPLPPLGSQSGAAAQPTTRSIVGGLEHD